MRLKLLIAVMAILIFSSFRTRTISQITQPGCGGHICSADVVGFTPPDWTVTYTKTSGKGKGDEPRDPCRKCHAVVSWSYSGGCGWVVSTSHGSSSGDGSGFGHENLEVECDGDPEGVTFWDVCNGVFFSADLFCPCD